MTLTIVITGSILVVATVHYINKETKKSEMQKRMLKNIESLLKEIWKLYYFIENFGQIDSFTTYLENASKRLYHGNMSENEFIKYKNEFKTTIQSEYKNLLSELIFVNPNIKKIINPEYFRIIK